MTVFATIELVIAAKRGRQAPCVCVEYSLVIRIFFAPRPTTTVHPETNDCCTPRRDLNKI